MISSETVPFIKTGGLADVVGALSGSLRETGDDARIVVPRFSVVSPEELTKLGEIRVEMGFGEENCSIYESEIPGPQVPVYFIDHPIFSERTGLYGGSGSHTYRDNHFRFALFSRAVLELCRFLSWTPEIFHSHDWQAAPVNAYLHTSPYNEVFAHSKSVFTIHNIGYQGIFSKHDIHSIGLSRRFFSDEPARYGESLNFLKAGILNADAVTTVSPTYAKEIQTPEYGEGLDPLLVRRKDSLYGILNGVDYHQWDPVGDPHIPTPYTVDNIAGKKESKRFLQEEFGLEQRADTPLIGIVSRLARQKGFYELCYPERGSLWRICSEMSVQVVVLGTGEDWIERELVEKSNTYPNLKAFITFSNRLAHLIEAGSDLFLMPSRYEPCGLNQIYSLRYGTLPIVRRTGGLADTVENYDSQTGTGTGFVFDDLTPESIYGTTEWAISTWYEAPAHFTEMQKRAMRKHYSWKDSSKSYRELYDTLLSK